MLLTSTKPKTDLIGSERSNLPFNPGMSEKAWEKLHIIMSRLNLKYASKLIKDRDSG